MSNNDFLMRVKCGLILFVMMSTTSIGAMAQNLQPEKITGTWAMPDGSALVEIYHTNNEQNVNIRIKVMRLPVFQNYERGDLKSGEVRTDINNSKVSLRSRELKGLVIGQGFKYNIRGKKQGMWTGGKLYDPNTGKTFKAKLNIINENVIAVRAYMGISALGVTIYWFRADHYYDSIKNMYENQDP